MTHAQQTHTGSTSFVPAAAAAFVMAAALAMAVLLSGQLPELSISGAGGAAQDQAVVEAGRAWQLQREQQAGIGAISDAVRDSAADWEAQRKAQSGAGATDIDTRPTDPKVR